MYVIMCVTEPATAASGWPWAGFLKLALSNSVCAFVQGVCVSLSLPPLRRFLLRALRRPAYGRNVAVTCGVSPAVGEVLAPMANQITESLAFRNNKLSAHAADGTMGKARRQKRSDHVASWEKRQDPIPFAWPACERSPPPSMRVLW